MIEQTPWFNRKFPPIEDNGLLPVFIERLEGTPARLEQKLEQYDPAFFAQNIEGKWSINEEIGHLLDLEELWLGRVHDILDGKEEMRPADLSNKKTFEAHHNDTKSKHLVSLFTEQRNKLVNTLKCMELADMQRSALHPRLQIPMRIIDLAFFVAEHDDHHLSHMTAIYSKLVKG